MVASPHSRYLSTRFFASLDGLRFFCIAAVLWHHSPWKAWETPLASRGFLGVDMFFILSGFLIVTLLLRERDKYGVISFRDFYMRRTLRIFPIYFLYLFLLFSAYPFLGEESTLKKSIDDVWLYAITFTVNFAPGQKGLFAHLWSLSMEEQFYLFWPLLEAKGRRFVRPVIAGVLMIALLRDAGILAEAAPLVDRTPLSRTLIWGVALAHLLHSEKGYQLAYKVLNSRWLGIWILTPLFFILSLSGAREGWKAITVSVLMTAYLGHVVVQPKHILASLFEFKPLVYVGLISYGIYLYHMLFVVALEMFLPKVGMELWSLPGIAIYLSLLFVGSAASFHLIEQPIMGLRKYFARGETGRETAIEPKASPSQKS